MGGKGRREMCGETNVDLSNPTCKTDSQWGFAPWLRELKQGLWDSLEGWDGQGEGEEFQEGGDISVPVTDSCWCLTESNKIL